MAKGDDRREAIRVIAEHKQVSIAVASHIYACATIKQKKWWSKCAEMKRLEAKDATPLP